MIYPYSFGAVGPAVIKVKSRREVDEFWGEVTRKAKKDPHYIPSYIKVLEDRR